VQNEIGQLWRDSENRTYKNEEEAARAAAWEA